MKQSTVILLRSILSFITILLIVMVSSQSTASTFPISVPGMLQFCNSPNKDSFTHAMLCNGILNTNKTLLNKLQDVCHRKHSWNEQTRAKEIAELLKLDDFFKSYNIESSELDPLCVMLFGSSNMGLNASDSPLQGSNSSNQAQTSAPDSAATVASTIRFTTTIKVDGGTQQPKQITETQPATSTLHQTTETKANNSKSDAQEGVQNGTKPGQVAGNQNGTTATLQVQVTSSSKAPDLGASNATTSSDSEGQKNSYQQNSTVSATKPTKETSADSESEKKNEKKTEKRNETVKNGHSHEDILNQLPKPELKHRSLTKNILLLNFAIITMCLLAYCVLVNKNQIIIPWIGYKRIVEPEEAFPLGQSCSFPSRHLD